MSFPFYQQPDSMDCGPTCLRMIAKYFGRSFSLQKLRDKSGINREGVSLLGISEAAEAIGFKTLSTKTSFDKLANDAPLPCIVHWQQNHFVIVYKITKNKVFVADPAHSLLTYTHKEFLQGWISSSLEFIFEDKIETNKIPIDKTLSLGIALLLEPTPKFHQEEDDVQKKVGFQRLFYYLFSYKQLILQLIVGLIGSSILQLILPFLTQSVIDVGVYTNNLNFVTIVLIAQLMLMLGRVAIEFIRSWLLLYISNRLNLSILSDFFIKLMRLPLSFFDTKMFGDIMQRINDHHQIQQFLTGSSLNVLFSLFNLVIFGFVLAFYNLQIFIIFAIGSILYGGWVFLFLKERRNLNFKQFALSAKSQSNVLQLIQGMQEIKLSNAETLKRWEWERLQVRSFKVDMKSMALGQWQQAGGIFINESKNIFITFLAAQAVINGQLTLGAMMAMQYIIGQLNSPIQELIQFVQSFQNAKISLERINEIHELTDEEPDNEQKNILLPENRNIRLNNLSFKYPGINENVLNDISFTISEGKTTAIVGMSGSGKTTILKLLLKFYSPTIGEIQLGDIPIQYISHKLWRSTCGTVLQDGFIFSDTIANNIAVGDEEPDMKKLLQAVKVANVQEFIEGLPLGYYTKIGGEGMGISQGQKQRILIARAVYKDPEFIFFDEATNALDANNENIIIRNLEQFFKGKTVVVVAHRLSTVKNADHIIVLENGKIVEQGTHFELVYQEGKYYELVKNQLELGE